MEDLNKIITDLAKSKKLDMGQRWMPEELDIFLKYFRESELEKIDQMQQDLSAQGFERSKIHLLSLYQKNKNFLTFNKQATGEILAAIMADYYDNLEIQQQQQTPHKEETMRLIQTKQQQQEFQQSTTGGLQETFLYAAQQPPYQKSLELQQESARYTQESLYQRQNGQKAAQPMKIKKQHGNKNQQVERNQGNGRVSNYETNDFQPGCNSNIFQQQSWSVSMIKQQVNKRKPKFPKGRFLFNQADTAEQRFAFIEEQTRNCTGKNPKRASKKNEATNDRINEKSLQWMEHEFFYCTIDKAYYSANTFADVLLEFGIETHTKLKRIEWQALRSCMQGPTKFSQNFARLELSKLGLYRKRVREYQHSQQQDLASLQDIFNDKLIQEVDKIPLLRVGQLVIAIHPNCHHFHLGTVLTTNGDVVIVKFTMNDLGVIRIPDTCLSIELAQTLRIQPDEFTAQDINHYSNQRINTNPTSNGEFKQVPTSALLQDLDYFSMAFLIKLLDRKTLLINELKEYNDQAEASENQQNKESFFQKYGWTGIQINLIDNALKHVIAKFRLRGLNHFSTSS